MRARSAPGIIACLVQHQDKVDSFHVDGRSAGRASRNKETQMPLKAEF